MRAGTREINIQCQSERMVKCCTHSGGYTYSRFTNVAGKVSVVVIGIPPRIPVHFKPARTPCSMATCESHIREANKSWKRISFGSNT